MTTALHLESVGFAPGGYPVRNWFASRTVIEQAEPDPVREAREHALEMAGRIRDYKAGYLVFQEKYRDAYLDVLTLWEIHTYAYKASGVTPYLAVTAPTQGSGKTTTMEVLSTLACNPTEIETTPTPAGVRGSADDGKTIFIDEVDQLEKNKDFEAVMNGGYKAGGVVKRVGTIYSTFSPKVIAGIAREGTLPLATATLDRCIEIRLIRAKPGELRKRFRVDIMRDDPAVIEMREWMQEWTAGRFADIRDAYIEVPKMSTARAMQIWEPLFTIAGLLGGGWYERVVAAARLIDGHRGQAVDPNAALIADVATVVMEAWTDPSAKLTTMTAEVLNDLRNNLPGRKLVIKLTSDQLVKRLGAFGLRARVSHRATGDVMVFDLAGPGGLLPDWEDAFERYSE